MLVFHCHVTNYHKYSSLKQHRFIISQFPWDGVQHCLVGSSAQSLTRLQSRCQLGMEFYLRLGVLFQAFVVVGRAHFLAAVELMVACCWFTASRTITVLVSDLG